MTKGVWAAEAVPTRRSVLGVGAALAAGVLVPAARAQDAYPNRPVTIMVGFPPGTATDTVARLLAEQFSQTIRGSRFIVENRGGQGGSIGAAAVARSAPDGYTITVGASAPQAINPHIYPTLSYDPRKDFQPIGRIVDLPYALVVNKDLPYRSMKDLMDAAKAKPGEVTFASTGNGTTSHLLMSVLAHATGARLNHVPFRGTAQSVTDIIAGRINATIDTVAGTIPFIRDGQVRALAVTSQQRSSLLPDVPTTAEAGYPDLRGGAWLAMFAPAGIPKPVLDRLSTSLREALANEKIRATLQNLGMELAPSTPDEMSEVLLRDYDRWGEIVRLTGAKAD
ncbi:Bug family tripartite tricarboxylate transporter substrate binding protein [Enterovirga rhinocerotis]|uniref:Tripartite-type tricarboxylate transporter receptor subunit TctC n=1 Tax=Enterovirga rhinocerotis TaxID=1339210 RepID=A0A4R7C3S6_9HYPH|nr:tripartite tricarboxylate transporter substrate binding protein [Enterovirga rhinocerotis]TDR93104.1 tripartite-type tricarboxylate transporter receptor subunit TctC [Enterovirga rhinocerotis]